MWQRFISVSLPAVLLVVAWGVTIRLSPHAAMFMGSPSGTARVVTQSVATGTYLRDLAITATEAIVGWACGASAGVVLGLFLWRARPAARMLEPYFLLFGALPAFALGPVLIFWLGTGLASKIALSGSATFVIVTMQAYSGSKRVDARFVAMARSFGASDGQLLRRVIAPASLMWIVAGLQASVGMALLGAVVGEFIAASSGLGHAIVVAEGLFHIDGIWAGVLGIAVIAATMQFAILKLQQHLQPLTDTTGD